MEKMGYDPLPFYAEPPESPLSNPEMAQQYPLILTTGGRLPFFFNSEHRQIDSCRKGAREPRAEIHPRTAAETASRTATGCGSKTAGEKFAKLPK